MEAQRFQPGTVVAGFRVVAVRELPEYGSVSVHWRHEETGCEAVHLVNEDPENLFAFAFRTPPEDDTGVAHILEHSVLCGSREFPLKDPFVVLLKTSLQTFLNAFTFPDKTVYPASSMVESDFFNLLRVYGDAVFFPLLKEEVFMQEGHHLELQGAELRRVGVVYNEMKGVYSSAEAIVGDFSTRSLFSDSPYGHESGGDPRAIPQLTSRGLAEFHRRYYHPSNCRIFLYGNIPPEKTLGFLQEHFVGQFRRQEVAADISPQPRWASPRRFERTFPVESRASLQGRSTVTLNWLTVSVREPLELLTLELLAEVLVGNVGSPLQKALLESGLGDDLSPATGLETELLEALFTVGLRGTDPEREQAVEGLVLSTLQGLARDGIPQRLVEAAVHRVEFRNREIRRGGRPYSLTLMRRCLRGWLHGTAPEATLEFRPRMDLLKGRLREPGYLEGFLRRHFLDNSHRSTLLVKPDADQGPREEAEERQALERVLAGMSQEERRRLEEAQRRLRDFQTAEDSPEQRARIPSLGLSDLRRQVEVIPSQRLSEGLPVPLLFHDLFTNGVVYVDLVVDTSGLEEELHDLLPLYGKATTSSGLPGVPYDQVAGELSLLTGGFGAVLSVDSVLAPGRELREGLVFRVKMLEEKVPEALRLVGRLLAEADFGDLNRLGRILLEMRNDMKGSLVPAGNFYASLRAGSRLSPALAVEERWKGVSQYVLLSRLAEKLESRLGETAAALTRLRGAMWTRGRLLLNVTCPAGTLPRLQDELAALVESLPPGEGPAFAAAGPAAPAVGGIAARRGRPEGADGRLESLAAVMNVGYVAHVLPASRFGSAETAHESVLAHFLGTGYLWETVRMKGGAYGAAAGANGLEGLFTFSSYRDPNIVATLEAFRGALRHGSAAPLSAKEFEEILIGTAGREERPLAPGEKGLVALKRELLGISDTARQERRDAILDTSAADMAAAARRLLERFEEGFSVVLAGSRALSEAAQQLPELAARRLELPE